MPSSHQHLSHRNRCKLLLSILTVMALVEFLNIITGRWFSQFGIVPRQVSSLPEILIAPFIHGSVLHLASNSIPFAILGFLLLVHGLLRYILVSLWVIIVGGGLVWLFGRQATHIGASGLIYGYFAYLVVAGLLGKEFKLLLISILVVVVYGGMVWGILPRSPYVSWESHLFGALAGLIAALFWARQKRKKVR